MWLISGLMERVRTYQELMGAAWSPAGGQAATLRSLGVAVVAGAKPTVHDLAGQGQGQGGGAIAPGTRLRRRLP